MSTHSAQEALDQVLAHGGASLPWRDAVDARIVREVSGGTASFGGSRGAGGGIIDSQDDVGGWPLLASGPAPADADHDGMPDSWENARGLDPGDPGDGPLMTADGTTNLERYLNDRAAARPAPRVEAALPWSRRITTSFLLRHPGGVTFDSLSPDERWNYEQGLMLVSLLDMWRHTGDDTYADFVRENLDRYIGEDGSIRTYRRTDYNLDNIGPGRALLAMYERTGEERYRRAADTLRAQLREQPRTLEGGFWHKKIYPYQMWLDGLFMAAPFLTRYAVLFGEPEALDDVVNQFTWIERHTRDGETGLLAHGWDESRAQRWAHPVTGRSPGFWGRAMGWYAMALVDVLEFMPSGHARRGELVAILRRLASALEPFRDPERNVWHQVVDQQGREGNYPEASVSCMLAFAFAKGAAMGWLDEEYARRAEEVFAGVIREFVTVDEEGCVDLHRTCRSAGLGGSPYRDGSFAYYISEPTRKNDMKGYGPFLRAAVRIEGAARERAGR